MDNYPFPPDPKFIKNIQNKLFFSSYLGAKLPLGFMAGLRLDSLDAHQCSVSLPYRWRTQNPFRSIYFAAQSMAAEMSTAALAMLAIRSSKEDISMLVTHLEASFGKKANARATFQCTQGEDVFWCIQKAVEGEPQTLKMTTVGSLPHTMLLYVDMHAEHFLIRFACPREGVARTMST